MVLNVTISLNEVEFYKDYFLLFHKNGLYQQS